MTIVGVAVLASLPAFLVALGGGGIGVAIGGLLLATVVGAMASLLLAANITRPLKQLTTLMAEVAAHNLNVIVPRPGGDETGRVLSAFANMLVSLRKTIGEVSQSAVEIASTSGELSASAAKIASNALAASERSSGAAAASEQVAVAAGHIADNCAIASQAASAANEFANASAYVSMESINSINAIAERVKGSSECIGRLGERSQQIGTIVSTIKDIAGQTNLLALNAAIEAARAGEMGRGFAVVADEVRKLAERTTQATQEISAMIELIQAETLSAVGSMELGMVDVEKGVEEGARSSEAICEILNQVIQLSGEISQIASAAQEQKTATDDISANIQQVSTTVEGSAHEAKTVAAAATNLSRQASLLTSLVANFRI